MADDKHKRSGMAAKPRPLDGGDSFWLEDNPLRNLASFDPLRETTAQSRALRKGEPFIPFEQRPQEPLGNPAPVSPPLLPSAASSTPLELLARANADSHLSYMGLKILLTVLTFPPGEPISLSRFSEQTGLSKTGVISGIRNSLDAGYITRSQSCPRCSAPLPYTEDKKTVPCAACKREVPPQARYTVFFGDSSVFDEDSPVTAGDNLPAFQEISPATANDSPVTNNDSPPVLGNNRGAAASESSPVIGKDSLNQRAARLASRMNDRAVSTKDRAVIGNNSATVTSKDSPHARADSESFNRISDSRIPPSAGNGETGRVVYGSQAWQQMTEKLAKDSAKRIGDKSVGFHVKVWAHARKLDWENGGRRFEDGLLTVAQELEGKYNSSGRSQGALWTKMVRRYFEEKGNPLLTEAEAEEWREVHRTYQPPQL